jgi:hypothetical protein
VDGEAEHLGQIAHRRLAAVVLPVGVGDEADGGVEREVRRHGAETARVQREKILQPLDRVEREESGDRKHDHRDRIGIPILLPLRIDPGQAVEAALDRPEHRSEKVSFAGIKAGDQSAERNGACHHQREHEGDLRPPDKRHRDTLRSKQIPRV